MKNRDEILHLIKDIMQELFEIEAGEVTLDSHLYEDLDFDSIYSARPHLRKMKRYNAQI